MIVAFSSLIDSDTRAGICLALAIANAGRCLIAFVSDFNIIVHLDLHTICGPMDGHAVQVAISVRQALIMSVTE